MTYELKREDLDALILGACFFGSGGGGTVISAQSLLKDFKQGIYYPSDRIRVVTVDEAHEGDAVMVAYMGAPEAIADAKYPVGPVQAVEQVQKRLAEQGRKLTYVVPPESGALGFLVACLVAAKLDLIVIDADGAGRAVPSLPMLTFAAAEISPRPAFLVSQGGLCVELDVTPRGCANGAATHQQDVSTIVEQMMRPIVADPEFGQFGGLAIWVMAASQLPSALPIRDTLKRALTLGLALKSAQIESADAMIHFLREKFNLIAYRLSEAGEFESVDVSTSGGFDVGQVHIRSTDRRFTVVYQNESLLAWDSESARPVGMAPDSLAYFVAGPGQAVYSNGDLVMADGSLNPSVKNRTVTLLGWRAEAPLTVPGGLILTSFMTLLNSLGYLGPYSAIDSTDLVQQRATLTTATGDQK